MKLTARAILLVVLLLGGVATWLAGNFAFVREVVELPEHEADKEEL